MAGREIAPASEWQLEHVFKDVDGKRITCGRLDCSIGSYALMGEEGSMLTGPACTTCDFTGDLGDVFNPDEPRFEPGAPESFKIGAALVMTRKPDTSIDVIRMCRPETGVMIDEYAAQEAR